MRRACKENAREAIDRCPRIVAPPDRRARLHGLRRPGRAPPPGLLYSNLRAPIDVDSDQTQLGTKSGKAISKTVLGLFSWGDASVRGAALDGGLTTIRHVDDEYYNVLGIYSTFTTVVYGD